MKDYNRVIYDIERCICHVPDACRDCSKYHKEAWEATRCMESLMADALELLKEAFNVKFFSAENVERKSITGERDSMNNQQQEGSLSSEIVHNAYQIMTLKAAETMDDFIFQRVGPFCEEVFQMKLNKSLLIRALVEYFQNHPEERTINFNE